MISCHEMINTVILADGHNQILLSYCFTYNVLWKALWKYRNYIQCDRATIYWVKSYRINILSWVGLLTGIWTLLLVVNSILCLWSRWRYLKICLLINAWNLLSGVDLTIKCMYAQNDHEITRSLGMWMVIWTPLVVKQVWCVVRHGQWL